MSCVASAAASRVAPRVSAADGARRRDRVSRGARRGARPMATTAEAASVDVAAIEDAWIAGSIERCAVGDGVAGLREGALARLAHARMPTQRVEDYRFTDLAPLVAAKPAAADPALAAGVDASKWTLEDASTTRVVLVDGVFCEHLSDLSGIPKDVECGVVSAGAKPSDALGAVSAIRAGVFDDLNAVMANDVVILTVPAGVKMRTPLHVVQLSTALPGDESIATSAPRLVVDVQDGAEVVLVEEFASAAGAELSAYWLNGVCEIRVGKNACVTHSVVQAQSRKAVHTRATHVTQAEESTYSLAEVNVGGAVGRHDLTVTQLGARTSTNLSCFNLAGAGQCLDLHSAVTLDHEEGKTDQVHKCIVSHATGRGVFDGNVKVNKEAQRTDAGQISRNLLLVPKATVNVKPNLQIVADDVVCTHGCTVSDLEEEELFYIQSRGLSPATARSLLVAGFGLEIASKLVGKDLRVRAEKAVRDALDQDDVVMVA
jgi:Fe-S cluster assembly protein SufD